MKIFFIVTFVFFYSFSFADDKVYNEKIQKAAIDKYKNILKEFTTLSDKEIRKENFTYTWPYEGVYSIHSDNYGLMQYIILNNEIHFRGVSIEPFRILKKFRKYTPEDFIKKFFKVFYGSKTSESDYTFLSKEIWENTNCYRFMHIMNGKKISDDCHIVLHLTRDNESVSVLADNGVPICFDKPINISREKARTILEGKALEVLYTLSKDYVFHPDSKQEKFFDLVYAVPSEHLVSLWEEAIETSDKRLREKQEAYLSYELEFQIEGNYKGFEKKFHNYMKHPRNVYTLETFPHAVYETIVYSFFLRCDAETGKYLGGRFCILSRPPKREPTLIEQILKYIANILGY